MRLFAARATGHCSCLIVLLAGVAALSADAPAAQASVEVEVSGRARRMVLRYELAEPRTRIVEIGGSRSRWSWARRACRAFVGA
ncbi:MAG: hypothetical protein ACYSW1_04665 [Planctomycetota bacterium]|jgi:hypothetical protein